MKYATSKLDRLWKKWEPWLSSTVISGNVASMIALAPQICPQLTGIPSQ